MNEFLGQSGNVFYIINQDFDEACSFNTLGNEIESGLTARRAAVNCLKVDPIDVISILGTNSVTGDSYSEVYFNGYSAPVNESALQVFASIRKGIRSIGGRYYYRKSDEYSQIFLTVKKDTATKEFLESLIGKKLTWKKLI